MSRRPDLSPATAFWAFVALLLISAVWFTVAVEIRRAERQAQLAATPLKDGEAVTVATVIDGDEVTVRRGPDAFVVRLLGLKCPFDINDGVLARYARTCRDGLQSMVGGGPFSLHFDTYATDRHGRVLAYLHRGDTDVGQAMLKQGWAVVFTAYPFGREAKYLAAEAEARQDKAGMWSDPRATARINAARLEWAARREE